MKTRLLLSCGIISSVLYIALNIFIPARFPGYDPVSQTISELSAWDAPTRTVWVWMAALYVLLFGAFGWGIFKTAGNNWLLSNVAYLVLVYAVINIYWPPMHLRGAGVSLSDKLHIIWAVITVIFMLLIMGIGMTAMGRAFRYYTIGTFAIFIVFGALTFSEAPGIPRNLPTPHIGIWERINVAAFMVWVIFFSIALLKREKERSRITTMNPAREMAVNSRAGFE